MHHLAGIGEVIKEYNILERMPWEKKPLERRRCRWGITIKLMFQEESVKLRTGLNSLWTEKNEWFL
jgi:hypothetical protein